MSSAGASEEARSFLTLFVQGEAFALPVEQIGEVIRVPELVPVPRSPASLAGLANLRGTVLPVADLRRLLRREEGARTGEERVLVLRGEAPLGLLVDAVGRLLDADPDALAPVAGEAGDQPDAEVTEALIRGAEGEAALPVIAPMRLLRRDFARGGRVTARETAAAPGAARPEMAPAEAIRIFVTFAADGEEYALPADLVEEVAAAPDTLADAALGEGGVAGVVVRRGRLLPLLSLRRLLGRPASPPGASARIVVLRLGEAGAVGLLVDRLGEMLRLPASLVDPVPPLLARRRPGLEIEAICRAEGGRRLVAVLSPGQLLRFDGLQQGDAQVGDMAGEGGEASMEQFVVFRLGEEEFGVPVAEVEEVLRMPASLTPVPNAPAMVEGVINLRGQVLPVVDQRRRFGLPERPHSGGERIMVFRVGGLRAGFIVDAVTEVLRAPPEAVGPAPDLARDQASPLVARVVNMASRGRLVLVLDTARLLDREEADALGAGQPSGDD